MQIVMNRFGAATSLAPGARTPVWSADAPFVLVFVGHQLVQYFDTTSRSDGSPIFCKNLRRIVRRPRSDTPSIPARRSIDAWPLSPRPESFHPRAPRNIAAPGKTCMFRSNRRRSLDGLLHGFEEIGINPPDRPRRSERVDRHVTAKSASASRLPSTRYCVRDW